MALSSPRALAVDCEGEPPSGPDKLKEIQEYQKACESKISELQSQQKTLESAIKLIDSKAKLTQAQIVTTTNQINQLQQDINTLSGVIDDLNKELDALTQVYLSRVRESYKNRHQDATLQIFSDLSYATLQSRIKYLSVTQKRDQIILHELETARLDYDQQKQVKEEKQAEVEALKARLETQRQQLVVQQQQKQTLLSETRNSEARYQQLLEKAVAELRAIESIIAGEGSEVEVGDISAGEKIATVIAGASACSTGTHLHFEVVRSKSHQNPANFLKSIGITWSNSPDGAFSFSGSWDWPLSEPVRITQGYGRTAYSQRYANDQHTGIDMVSENREVKAVRKGKLYRGSIACGGGTLKYVHVDHADDDLDTYYLHVNYF